jgi:hypothetical protein
MEFTEKQIESLLLGGAVATASGTLIERISRVDYDGQNFRIKGWVRYASSTLGGMTNWFERWATIRP